MVTSKKFYTTAAAIILTDQLIKFFASSEIKLIPNYLSIKAVHNTGIAFGLLQGSNLLFAAASAAVAALIIIYHKKIANKTEQAAAALILGGAASNLTDRILHGAVIDYIATPYIATFNIADAALTVGAALIITAYLQDKFIRHAGKKSEKSGKPDD
ncbi:signal peptidase II [Candidatus Woesearchaeota archaeon]|nr:signal peptidase II [Candidatus Woesearchaeota archaeon]